MHKTTPVYVDWTFNSEVELDNITVMTLYLVKSEACELGICCQGVTGSSSEQTHHSCCGNVKSTQFLVSLSPTRSPMSLH